jgi:anti-sigma B factor antagonist
MHSPTFVVEVSCHEDTAVLALAGELDIATVDQFSRAVEEARVHCTELDIDLTGLDFLDSSGLRAIVSLHNASEAQGFAYSLRGAPPRVQRIFALTGLDELLVFA